MATPTEKTANAAAADTAIRSGSLIAFSLSVFRHAGTFARRHTECALPSFELLLPADGTRPLCPAPADRVHHVLAGPERVVEAAFALIGQHRGLRGAEGEGRVVAGVALELAREVVVRAADVGHGHELVLA